MSMRDGAILKPAFLASLFILLGCLGGCSSDSRLTGAAVLPTIAQEATSSATLPTMQPALPTSSLAPEFVTNTPVATRPPTIEIQKSSDNQCRPVLPSNDPEANPYQTIVQEFDLAAPSGSRIYGLIRQPDPALYPDLCFPAVVFVPGGINPGRVDVNRQDAKLLAGAGMVVVGFNAEGRVEPKVKDDIRSEGEEDYNGYRQQDGLCKLVEYVMGLDNVITYNVGLRTTSYGITMGAGCAGRYPEIPIKYIVDEEGPSDSFVTCHGPRYLAGELDRYEIARSTFGRLATWQDDSPENLAWWEEREAVNFIGNFRGYYLRLQAEWDHAQPPDSEEEVSVYTYPDGWPDGGPAWWQNKHTTDMVNAAVWGGAPWVRVNFVKQGNGVNTIFDAEYRPVFLPGRLADRLWSVQAVLEMAGMD
ncbi:MAG: hypothetical protein JXA42_23840 [Anaerolineales bacterium]|nr:hypothetical protein [Anaerolineales bacterium]